ncbi:hypothetical protein ACWOFR_13525 [Carnobacterium gallinarum]|uniref:hypothetical protein n=1 Tax=Carnobacterium gallinarum TaxID=2749 RepID=UPI000AB95E49|nr:hypothetical protein [Carnobacterium gallinarum]
MTKFEFYERLLKELENDFCFLKEKMYTDEEYSKVKNLLLEVFRIELTSTSLTED